MRVKLLYAISILSSDIDDDDEVSELTSSSRSHTTYAMLTAESVAKFMKGVNRIRFNSLTSRNSVEKLSKLGSKSLSCPQLPKIDPATEEEDELSRSASTTFPHSHTSAINFEQKSVDETNKAKPVAEDMNVSVTSTSSTVTITTKQETTVTVSASENKSSLNITNCPLYSDPVKASREKEEDDFTKIFRQLLNPAYVSTCQRCQSQSRTGEDQAVSRSVKPGTVIFIYSF